MPRGLPFLRRLPLRRRGPGDRASAAVATEALTLMLHAGLEAPHAVLAARLIAAARQAETARADLDRRAPA